jgi:hypothetical protein
MVAKLVKWMAIIFVVWALGNFIVYSIAPGAKLVLPGLCLLIPLGMAAAVIEERVRAHRRARTEPSHYQLTDAKDA